MNPLVSIAIEAARAAGRIIVKGAQRPDLVKVTTKLDGEYTTDIDQRAEEAIIRLIQKSYPSHGFLAEESGGIKGESDITWVIDPLDGTKNFVHNSPHYAVSIAIQVGDKIEHGVIYDPVRDELFVASSGRGAQMNDRRIRLAQRAPEAAIIAINYPNTTSNETLDLAKKIAMLSSISGGLRQTGSAALDFAYVAAGRFDVCLSYKLRLWDFAAGILLITEAGGLTSDWQGGENYYQSGQIYTTHPKLYKHFIKAVSQ